MIKKIYIQHIILLMFFAFGVTQYGYSQVTVATAGTTVNSNAGEMSYTIGQSFYMEIETPTEMIYQGVQQPYCQSSSDTLYASVCQSSEFNGYNFNISNSQNAVPGVFPYIHHFTNVGGCDSVVTLILTVIPTSSSEEFLTGCDYYTWHGMDYTENIDTTFLTNNVQGCDSTHTIHLTINHSSQNEFSAQAYHEYTWETQIYYESGIYQQTFINGEGCDSVVTLNLTISDKPIPIIYTYNRRVLVVDHYPINPNERVDYAAYRWFRNDQEIPQASLDQYFEDGFPFLSGCYYVMVPGDPTQLRWVKSNVICMENLSIEDVEDSGIDIRVTPNPILSGNNLTVQVIGIDNPYGLKLKLFDNTGRTLQSIDVNSPSITISMPYASGYYSLYLYNSEGIHCVKKIIVHR